METDQVDILRAMSDADLTEGLRQLAGEINSPDPVAHVAALVCLEAARRISGSEE